MRYGSVQNAEIHLFCSENHNFIVKSDSEKYTQISSVGVAVYRQVMKRKARNPRKTGSKINQRAEGATDIISVVHNFFLAQLPTVFGNIT